MHSCSIEKKFNDGLRNRVNVLTRETLNSREFYDNKKNNMINIRNMRLINKNLLNK